MGEVNMELRLLLLFCYMSFSIMASAQASGGQIRRQTQKAKTETRKKSKPRVATRPFQKPPQQNVIDVPQPVPISSLLEYNVVVGSFKQLGNAQELYRTLSEQGWNPQIYLDSSKYYQVIITSSNSKTNAITYRDNLKKKYPNSWILCIENGKERRYTSDDHQNSILVYKRFEERDRANRDKQKHYNVTFVSDRNDLFFSFNGNDFEKTNDYNLTPGKHTVYVRCEGENELKSTISVEDAYNQYYVSFDKRTIISLKNGNKVSSSSPQVLYNVTFVADRKDLFISVDGINFEKSKKFQLSSGIHTIFVRCVGEEQMVKDINVKKGDNVFDISFNRRTIESQTY